MDQPAKGPDTMRTANGRIFVAENGSGEISASTVDGDKASVTVVKEGLKTPTGVEPAGDNLDRRARRRPGRVGPRAQITCW